MDNKHKMGDSEAATRTMPDTEQSTRSKGTNVTQDQTSRRVTKTDLFLKLAEAGTNTYGDLDGGNTDEDDVFYDDKSEDDSQADYDVWQIGDEPLDLSDLATLETGTAKAVAVAGSMPSRLNASTGPRLLSTAGDLQQTLVGSHTNLQGTTEFSSSSGAVEACEDIVSDAVLTPKQQRPSRPIVHNRSSSLRAAAVTPRHGVTQAESQIRTTIQDAKPRLDPLAPTAAAPYGYKPVKVREAGGTIVTIKRPLTAEQALEPARQDVASSNVQNKTATPAVKGLRDTRQIEVSEKEVGGDPTITTSPSNEYPVTGPVASSFRQITQIMNVLTWAVMIIIPLLFLGLAIAVAVVREKPVSGEKFKQIRGETKAVDPLTEARDIAVSMWPIVFAAIVAQSLKAFAAFKVERGIQLITLEQLIGSSSLGGAVKQPFVLRTINWTSIVLFAIWGLSPLAGQAILRMGWTEPQQINEVLNVSFFAPQQMSYTKMEFAEDPVSNIMHVAQVDAMYTGLLIGNNGSRWAAEDFWTNVKIPDYDAMDLDQDDEGFKEYETYYNEQGMIEFTGLSGIPVWPVSEKISSYWDFEFNITTSHFVLDCTAPESLEVNSGIVRDLNLTTSPSGTLYLSAENNTLLYEDDSMQTGEYYGPGESGVIHFGSADRTNNRTLGERIFYSRCSYEQQLIRSTIYCDVPDSKFSCRVRGQKPATVDDRNETKFQPLGLYFAQIMRNCGGNPISSSAATETEQYVRNPAFASAKDFWNTSIGLGNLTAEEMSTNFGVAVNTLWLAGTKHKALLGGNLTLVYESSGHVFPMTYTEATASVGWQNINKISWPWCTTLIVCSILLLAAGVAAILLENRTIGPDFLGFANTAIRKGVRLPKYMNTLSARERLQALSEAEVLLQDVRPNNSRGRIALGLNDEEAVRLIKGRIYQ